VEFETGEYVRVRDGPFTDFNGTVEVNYDKNKASFSHDLWSRNARRAEFSQIEKT
jgi:transcriptional antiterminator NusG